MSEQGDVEFDPVWAVARERVRSYLSAHGVHSPLLEELAGQIVQMARDRVDSGSPKQPSAVAIDCAIELIDSWVSHIVGSEPEETPGRRIAHERASVHLARIPREWPGYFLSARQIPEELASHLKSTHMMAGPSLEFSKMTLRPIDLGPVSDAADSTWRTFDKLPVLRAVAAWTIYVGLLALAFVAVRP